LLSVFLSAMLRELIDSALALGVSAKVLNGAQSRLADLEDNATFDPERDEEAEQEARTEAATRAAAQEVRTIYIYRERER